MKQFVVLAVLVVPTIVSGQPKRVYIAPDDHTDYWWSATEDTYRTAFLDTLDYYLDLADATAGNAPHHQSRWNCDGSLWMWTYEKNRTPAQFQRLINRVADGHVSVPLNGLCVSLGGAPAEAVLRGMYYPGHIERRHGVRFRLAYTMENQTQPYGLWSLWAGSGARYSWKGICGCATQVPDAGDREHEVYWAVGPDGRRMLVKWNSMLWGNQSIGGYAEARNPSAAVDDVTVNAPFNGFQARYPYDVIGCFGKGWDDVQTQTDEFVTVAVAKTDATRTVIVSNEQDYFEDFEAAHGADIPSQSVSFGNEWDLHCASMAETSARVKRAVERLRTAEALAAIVSPFDPSFLPGREDGRDEAWMDLGLYWEHDFGMDGFFAGHPWLAGRIDWQHRLADEIEVYVDTLLADGVAALGELIPASGGGTSFYVFNPLGWVRTDYADLPWSDTNPVHVVEVATQQEAPSQIVTRSAQRFLCILAANVPAVGYRVFEILPGPGAGFSDAATVSGGSLVVENARVRVVVAERGAITSLVDKTRGNREFASVQGGRFLNDLGASTGSVAVENAGPVSVTLRYDAPLPVQHTSRITLVRDGDRVEIDNEITQNFEATQTWAFGFNLAASDVHHEEVGAILRARLQADGGHYSPRNARYDWLTLNHFADVTGVGPAGVTLSNADAYFMKLGNSSATSLDTVTPQVTVLAGGRGLGSSNGIPAQGGDSLLRERFALRTHDAYDPASAMKFSLEHQNPLVAATVTGTSPQLPADTFSAFASDNANVLLWALKPAEEGIDRGLIARLWNVADSPQSVTVQTWPNAITAATATTHLETDEGPLAVSQGVLTLEFNAQQIRTVRLFTPEEAAIPTVSLAGLAALVACLALAGGVVLRRRHARARRAPSS